MIYIAEEPEDAGLDEDFPLGDGTADTGAAVDCPYCGETVEIALDPAANHACNGVEARISPEGAKPEVWVIPTDEELLIARDTFRVVNGMESRY
jgi:acetate kinase